MDPGIAMSNATSAAHEDESAAGEFVRFCYRRRRVAWPELYDEMCAVASRGLFRGWGFADLTENGIGFTLPELPRLAAMAERIAQEERDRPADQLQAGAGTVRQVIRARPLAVGVQR
ncbi:MAG TPA: hypothetical protein VFK38_10430 [Candidatus Limnocylindrales bacterium]|nr:hypothetical protein [Candidatus Limnocylindrales bacterium]